MPPIRSDWFVNLNFYFIIYKKIIVFYSRVLCSIKPDIYSTLNSYNRIYELTKNEARNFLNKALLSDGLLFLMAGWRVWLNGVCPHTCYPFNPERRIGNNGALVVMNYTDWTARIAVLISPADANRPAERCQKWWWTSSSSSFIFSFIYLVDFFFFFFFFFFSFICWTVCCSLLWRSLLYRSLGISRIQ